MNYNELLENYCEIFKLINKKIKVFTINDIIYDGYLQTIDPVSGTLVITSDSNFDNTSPSLKLHLITSHSIRFIEILNQEMNSNLKSKINSLVNPNLDLNDSEIKIRKQKLINWFKLNQIPIVEKDNNELTVASVITLKSPYFKNDCICSNDIVLRRIQDLIERMPS